jgi:hypothetical protein
MLAAGSSIVPAAGVYSHDERFRLILAYSVRPLSGDRLQSAMLAKPNPSRSEIQVACKRIRRGWSTDEHERRSCGLMPGGRGAVGNVIVRGVIPTIALDPASAVVLNVAD